MNGSSSYFGSASSRWGDGGDGLDRVERVERLEQAVTAAQALEWPRYPVQASHRQWAEAWQSLGVTLSALRSVTPEEVIDPWMLQDLLCQARAWYERELCQVGLNSVPWCGGRYTWALAVAAANFIDCIDAITGALGEAQDRLQSAQELVHTHLNCPYLRLSGDNLGHAGAIFKDGGFHLDSIYHPVWVAKDSLSTRPIHKFASCASLQIVSNCGEEYQRPGLIACELVSLSGAAVAENMPALLWEGAPLVSLAVLERLDFQMLPSLALRATALQQLIRHAMLLADKGVACEDPLQASCIWQYPDGTVSWSTSPYHYIFYEQRDDAAAVTFQNSCLLIKKLLVHADDYPGCALEPLATKDAADIEKLIRVGDLESLLAVIDGLTVALPSSLSFPEAQACSRQKVSNKDMLESLEVAGSKLQRQSVLSQKHLEQVYLLKATETEASYVLKVSKIGALVGVNPVASAFQAAWPIYKRNRGVVARPYLVTHSSDSGDLSFLTKYAGLTLNKWVPKAHASEVIVVAMQLLQGLQTLQDCGLAHNDIKPANICVKKYLEHKRIVVKACFIDLTAMRPYCGIDALTDNAERLLAAPIAATLHSVKRSLRYGTVRFMPQTILAAGLSLTTPYSEVETLVASITDVLGIMLNGQKYRALDASCKLGVSRAEAMAKYSLLMKERQQLSPYNMLLQLRSSLEEGAALIELIDILVALVHPDPFARMSLPAALQLFQDKFPEEIAMLHPYSLQQPDGAASSSYSSTTDDE